MCFVKNWLRERDKKRVALVIPHPEEAMNPTATVETVDLASVMERWFTDWQVADRAFWRSVDITMKPLLTVVYNGQTLSVPAATYAEERRIEIDPTWCNPGIIAHENCHISYSLLSPEQKVGFANQYALVQNDPFIKLVIEYNANKNPVWRDDIVEIHADCYRYLGSQLSDSLKAFYPRLFSPVG